MSDGVRFRSNVVIIRDDDAKARQRARASLPGELATDVLSRMQMTAEQFEEMHLYQPCISCHRSLWNIARQGCPHICASLARARALRDVDKVFFAAREYLESQATDEREDAVSYARARVQPIPEWRP